MSWLGSLRVFRLILVPSILKMCEGGSEVTLVDACQLGQSRANSVSRLGLRLSQGVTRVHGVHDAQQC